MILIHIRIYTIKVATNNGLEILFLNTQHTAGAHKLLFTHKLFHFFIIARYKKNIYTSQ